MGMAVFSVPSKGFSFSFLIGEEKYQPCSATFKKIIFLKINLKKAVKALIQEGTTSNKKPI